MSKEPIFKRRYHYDYRDSEPSLLSYVTEEIKDRTKRHNHILKLLGFSEEVNTINPVVTHYYEEAINPEDAVGIREIELSDFIKDNFRCDTLPFNRDLDLSGGRVLTIKDDFDNDGKDFGTYVTLYKERTEYMMTGPDDVSISYWVSEDDEPLSLSVSYGNAEIFLGKNFAEFKYSDFKRERLFEVRLIPGENGYVKSAGYREEIGHYSPTNQKGELLVSSMSSTRKGAPMWEQEPYFAGGFGSDLEMNPITEEDARNYSQAIASHRRAQEVMEMALKIIINKVPALKKFINDEFPIVNTLRDMKEKGKQEAIVDTVYALISSPLLDFGDYGFQMSDEEIPKKQEINNRVLRSLKSEYGYPVGLVKYFNRSKK